MMTPILYAYFFLAALLLRPNESSEPATLTAMLAAERREELISERFGALFTDLADRQGFNGNVLLSHNGKVMYRNAFGYSNLRAKTPLRIESVFQLASVTKQFTAAAIMILHDEGKLEFDDPIQKFFPDLPYKNVTIRLLLGHRTGIPDYMNFSGKYWRRKTGFLTNASLMEMLIARRPRSEFTPDACYRYSNTNYAILASVIEKLSGVPYAEFMKQRVFGPLGMRSTFCFDPGGSITIPFPTTGYNANRLPAHDDYLSGVVGDKGIFSTVDDMFAWDQSLYGSSLLRQATLEEAFTPSGHGSRYGSQYGYGWRISTAEAGEKILYHAGWWRGYTTLSVRRPEDKTYIIVLSNKVNWSFRNIDNLLAAVDDVRYEILASRHDDNSSR